MKVWVRDKAFTVSDSEAGEIYQKVRAHRYDAAFGKMDVSVQGELVSLKAVTVGYECTLCVKRHMIYDKCDKEIVAHCVKCNKPISRFVQDRNEYFGFGTVCMSDAVIKTHGK